MMKPQLFEIEALKIQPESLSASAILNAEHPIFKGHFPETPVLPGVCQIEMLKEILAGAIGKQLFLPEAGSVKFLNVIEPQKTPKLLIEMQFKNNADGIFDTTATIADGQRFFLKFKGSFKITDEH